MARTGSKIHVGRYDETTAELRDMVKALPVGESKRMQSIALAVVDQLRDVAKADDTVHVNVNRNDDGDAGRTYSVTITLTPAPVPRPKVRPTPATPPAE